MDSTQQAPVWRVTSQVRRTRVDDAGEVRDGYDVAFTTGAGHAGVIFVPDRLYTPDRVREAIAAQAALLDSVGSLTADS